MIVPSSDFATPAAAGVGRARRCTPRSCRRAASPSPSRTAPTSGPAGSASRPSALVDELGDPPVVPPVAGVLAEPEDELVEGLLVGVEVVGERRSRARRGRCAGRPRTASRCPARSTWPDPHALVGRRRRGRPRRRSPGGSSATSVRTWVKPARSSQRCWRVVVGEGAGVDLLHVEARARCRPGPRPGRPSRRAPRRPVGQAVVELGVDDHDQQHPAGGAVVGAGPAADRCPRSSRSMTFSRVM